MRSSFTLLIFLAVVQGFAQPVLLPSIGLDALPADNAQVCPLPFQTPPITSTGYWVGDTAADFHLYDLDGNDFHLQNTLASGKPVLVVAGSWTCPVYRNKLGHLNQMKALYGEQIEIIVVYTVEAHPIVDISPYFGAVNPGQTNLNAGITFQQPTTYGERKALVQVMLDSMLVAPPVYLDGPCNAWWDHYGPAPNNAYLIGVDGIIAAKHSWYNKYPQDMECDIRAHLGLPNTCDEGTFNGSFSLQVTSSDTVYGTAGTTITASALITNASNEDVRIRVVKLQNDLPMGWSSSLCLDVCYLPDVDTALIVVPANSVQEFYFYFYTDPTPGTGHARIGFRNEQNYANSYSRNFWAVSSGGVGIACHASMLPYQLLYDGNAGQLHIVTEVPYGAIQLYDAQGRLVTQVGRAPLVDIRELPPGVYAVRLIDKGRQVGQAQRFLHRP